jgi:hypothetical protein
MPANPSIVLETVTYAGRLLAGSYDSASPVVTVDEHAHYRNLAMFRSRFFLTAKKELADVLIHRHLVVATSVLRAVNAVAGDTSIAHHMTCTYLPEPVLAEAAARWMSAPGGTCENYLTMLNSLEREIGCNGSGCAAVGDVGEMIAAVHLICVLDQLKSAKISASGYDGFDRSYMGDIPVAGYLKALCGEMMVPSEVAVRKYLNNCYMNFSHIYRRSDESAKLSQRDIKDLYLRGCAFFCGKGFEGTIL